MASPACCITRVRELEAPALGDKAVKMFNADVEGFASGQRRQHPESYVFFVNSKGAPMV